VRNTAKGAAGRVCVWAYGRIGEWGVGRKSRRAHRMPYEIGVSVPDLNRTACDFALTRNFCEAGVRLFGSTAAVRSHYTPNGSDPARSRVYQRGWSLARRDLRPTPPDSPFRPHADTPFRRCALSPLASSPFLGLRHGAVDQQCGQVLCALI
jgi:hypothetical protein